MYHHHLHLPFRPLGHAIGLVILVVIVVVVWAGLRIWARIREANREEAERDFFGKN